MNLVIISPIISEGLRKKGQVDVIYRDFSKTFGRLDHNIVLSKMLCAGFSHAHIFQGYKLRLFWTGALPSNYL